MLSYRHAYHAGNFADVVKHVSLFVLLESLLRKETACYVQDTHAGAGIYALGSAEATMRAEYTTGIARVLAAPAAPEDVEKYLQLVRRLNPTGELLYYPGSPAIVQQLLREQDRLLLTELHPQDYEMLYRQFRQDKRIAIHKQDAYQGLKAFLPPKEKRGLVFIDPPYERKDEYRRVVQGVQLGWQRWRHGVFAIWYPLMSLRQRDTFLQDIQAAGIRKILLAEFLIEPLVAAKRFTGCGMLIVNPPWQLDATLAHCYAWLLPLLQTQAGGSWRVEWLVPE